ncbi:MAG: hypothetical protein OHK0037_20450 [Elainellaceae cyanobacterium]
MVERPNSSSGPLPLIIFLLLAAVGTLIFNQPAAPPILNPQHTAPTPMLDDPEAETSEWEETINAMSAAIAHRKCRQLAEYYSQTGGSRVVVTSVTDLGNGLYRCKFLGETQGYDEEQP